MKKIGLYGGTFDPIHIGHLNFAVEMKEKLGLDEVWLIPALINPFKQNAPPIEASHRLNMCRLSIKGISFLKVNNIELKRKPPSFTVDTLRELTGKYHSVQFYLLLGEDTYVNFSKWKESEEITRLATLAVGACNGDSKRTKIRRIDISSTEVRERLKKNLCIRHLVPSKVVDYISKNQLYS